MGPVLMRYSPIVLAFLAAAAAAGDLHQYPGENKVIVELRPGMPPPNGVLLYPGGRYGRIEQQLLEPGENAAPIMLHMPIHKSAGKIPPKVIATRPAEPLSASQPTEIVKATPKQAKPVSRPVPKQVAVTGPQQTRHTVRQAPPTTDLINATPKPAAKKTPVPEKQTVKSDYGELTVAKPVAKPIQAIKSKQTRVASIEPTRRVPPTMQSGESKRGTILFEPNASNPSNMALRSVARIADTVNREIGSETRVQILAYAGPRGDKSSNTRRLSLKRALIVRQLLIDAGIPSEHIDVRAMGGVKDNGATDRVDILLKG
jgi:outer membrane protein OmpA-like peptidoglycan-associated protein